MLSRLSRRGFVRVLAGGWLAAGISWGRVSKVHARIFQKHASGGDRGARGRRVPSGQHGRIRAVDKQRELRRERVRIVDVELREQVAKPKSTAFLEMGGKIPRFTLVLSEFGQCVEVGATPVLLLRGQRPLQPREIGKDLLGRWLVRVLRKRPEPAAQICLDHFYFRAEMAVEGLLADSEFCNDRIDADGTDALPIEEAVDGFQVFGAGVSL